MKYEKLPYYGCVTFLYKYKVLLLVLIFTFLALLSSSIKEGFTHNDEELWIKGSSEHNKLLKEAYNSSYIKKVTIDLSQENFSIETVAKLKKLQTHLENQENVLEVNSLFSQKKISNQELSNEQQLMEIKPLKNYKSDEIYAYMLEHRDAYNSFIADDFKSVTYYVKSSKNIPIHMTECTFAYTSEGLQTQDSFLNTLLFVILFVTIFISFSIAFKSVLPSILGAIFITATSISTVAMFQMFSAVQEIHMSIILVSVTISVMDFVYVYYKWHVLQSKVSGKHALYRVLVKTIVPIFWTSLISVIAMGSLMFVDSHILYTIGLNVLLSAVSGFALSTTLLPVMLSFFSQKNPKIITKNFSKHFAAKEAKSSPLALKAFLLLTFFVFLYAMGSYYANPIAIKSENKNNQILIALESKGFTIENLSKLKSLEDELSQQFTSIQSFQSAYNVIEEIHKVEKPNTALDLPHVDLDAYLFSFDLYDLSGGLIIDERLTLSIYVDKNEDQIRILDFVTKEGFLIQDVNSLVSLAKVESISILFNVVIFVLLLIMIVIYQITKNKEFAIISLVVNIIPLIWFFGAIMLFHIPLSTEIFVAMIITVALSSDATLHFIYFYHQARHKPRNAALAIERSFVFVGTPVSIGNLILLLTFAMLAFVPNEIISNIGFYSTLLILLSLLVDLFILPVLFLKHIKNNAKVQDYFHG
jgi:predicted RND superfamily exporter protein